MEAKILSVSRAANFGCRVQRCLDNANVPRDALKNMHRFPHVVRMFHMITPHALQVLDGNVPLLREMNARLSKAEWLNGAPQIRLREMGLTLGYCNDPTSRVLLFYTLRGPSLEEARIIKSMGDEFVERPTLEDAGIVFEAFGIRLEGLGEWDHGQIKELIHIDMDKAIRLVNCRNMTAVAALGDRFSMGRADGVLYIMIPRNETVVLRSV
jgi:hypothetical protein